MKTIFDAKHFRLPVARLAKNFGLIGLGLLLAGCPSGKPPGPDSPAGSGQKVVIRGSNTIGEELAPQLIAEFKKTNPDVEFDLEAKATGYGLAGLRAGQCDIAAASRAPILEELDLAKDSGVEYNDHVIGSYSVAVVVHAGNPVANLTREQVMDIFTGKIENWKDAGGPDLAIQVHIRDPISGTHLGFKEIAMQNKDYVGHPNLHTNYAGIVRAVAADPSAIGYSGFAMAKDTGVKVVSIGEVSPGTETVHSGRYPYARLLRFYTNKTRESQPTKDFIQFVMSARGQEILAEMGFTPKP